MKISREDIGRLHILARAIKVWFFTILAGSTWIFFAENECPRKFEEWLMLFVGFGTILFITFPVLFLTTIMLSLFSNTEGQVKKAIRVFVLTLLLNLIVYFLVLIFLNLAMDFIILSYLGRFTVMSMIMVFLLNRDWFISPPEGRAN